MRVTSIGYLVLAGTVLASASTAAWARSSNSTQITAKNGSTASGGSDCTICHTPSGSPGSVQIIGAPTSYGPSEVYDLTVRVADPTKSGAGFQISVEDSVGNHIGALSIIDAVNTDFNIGDPNWVNHTATGVDNAIANWVANGNQADFTVRWTSPASDAGPVTFWAVGNAVDDGGTPSNDNVYLADATATFSLPVPAVSEWGLLVLSLSMMAAATAVLSRRRGSALPVRIGSNKRRG